jgi:hypothetical protein
MLENKNGHFGPGNMNSMSLSQEHRYDGKKLTWFQLHSLPENDINDCLNFRKHAAHMSAFRKSHLVFQNAGTACLMEEPVIYVDADTIENGGSRNPLQDRDSLFVLTENLTSTHQFSLS